MAVKTVRILVTLPEPMKAQLDTLKAEGFTASGYLRTLLKRDLEARKGCGWVPGEGFLEGDTEEARRAIARRQRTWTRRTGRKGR